MSIKYVSPTALLSGEYSTLVDRSGAHATIVDEVSKVTLQGLEFITVPIEFGTLYLDPDIEVGVLSAAPREFALYFVGGDKEDALEGSPFDSIGAADAYQQEQGGSIYRANVSVLDADFLVAD